jgi:hypothetical protein
MEGIECVLLGHMKSSNHHLAGICDVGIFNEGAYDPSEDNLWMNCII